MLRCITVLLLSLWLGACAIPTNKHTPEHSSQLLYGDELGMTGRLAVKGKLAVSYRAAQPAINACVASLSPDEHSEETQARPFDADDDGFEESQ